MGQWNTKTNKQNSKALFSPNSFTYDAPRKERTCPVHPMGVLWSCQNCRFSKNTTYTFNAKSSMQTYQLIQFIKTKIFINHKHIIATKMPRKKDCIFSPCRFRMWLRAFSHVVLHPEVHPKRSGPATETSNPTSLPDEKTNSSLLLASWVSWSTHPGKLTCMEPKVMEVDGRWVSFSIFRFGSSR